MSEMSSAFKELAQGYRCHVDEHLQEFDEIINGQAKYFKGTSHVDSRSDLKKVAQIFCNIRDLANRLLEYVDYEENKERQNAQKKGDES